MSQREHVEILVLGGGPAGFAAARPLTEAGRDVLVVDENPHPGGAIGRRRFDADASDAAGVRFTGETVCHGVLGRCAVLSRRGELRLVDFDALIVAVGAHELVTPFPGSTLRGVITCGAAQTMLKGSGTFPWRSAVVAGNGPLLLAAASQLVDAGVDVRALVDRGTPTHQPRAAVGALLRTPHQVMREGAGYLRSLRRGHVPLRWGSAVLRVDDHAGAVRSVTIARLGVEGRPDPRTSREVHCDALVVTDGFEPTTDLLRQMGARMQWDRSQRFWTPTRSTALETSLPGVYAIGDCTGIGGHLVAEAEGRLIAEHLLERDERPARRRLAALSRFRSATDAVYVPRTLSERSIAPEAIVCRCEGVRRQTIDEAADLGAEAFRSVKLMTRAGMGICQGRTCTCTIQRLIADQTGLSPTTPPKAQFPVRPMRIAAMAELADVCAPEGMNSHD